MRPAIHTFPQKNAHCRVLLDTCIQHGLWAFWSQILVSSMLSCLGNRVHRATEVICHWIRYQPSSIVFATYIQGYHGRSSRLPLGEM